MAANQAGATPLLLATLNGNAAMHRAAVRGRGRSERPADQIRRHRADDGVAHRQDRMPSKRCWTMARR